MGDGVCGVGGGVARRDQDQDEAPVCRVPSSKEDEAAARVASDRDAEQRRDDLVSQAGPSRAGASDRHATCASAKTEARTNDWTPAEKNAAAQRAAAARTALSDRPIQSDPLGNAIVAGVAGGVVAGVGTAVATASLGAAAGDAAVHGGKHVAKEVVLERAKETFHNAQQGPYVPTSSTATPASSPVPAPVSSCSVPLRC
jgi:hypothetical protein